MTIEEQRVADSLLKNPKIEPLINKLGEAMTLDLPTLIGQLSNMKPGDVFEETGQCKTVQQQLLTGKPEQLHRRRFKLLGPAMPTKPHVIARMTADLARQSFTDYGKYSFMIYHDDAESPDDLVAFYVIQMHDFCKMFAVGEWALVTELVVMNKEGIEDQFEQKGILDSPAGTESEISKIIRP